MDGRPTVGVKRKLLMFAAVVVGGLMLLGFRVFYIQAFEAEFLQGKAYEQQTRDRLLTPRRGAVVDRNGVGLAVTETVCSVSVIRAQVADAEKTARALSEMLGLDYAATLKKVTKRVALERIQTKVEKGLADEIRRLGLPGVVVDEDVKRVYPYGSLAAQVIGFVGKDNQGVVGLEAKYDALLKGEPGKILTGTDARGMEAPAGTVERLAPGEGQTLVTTLDSVIQRYAEQTIQKAVAAKSAKCGLIIAMNPQNGEILALANEPGFDLNEPFTINNETLKAQWDTFDGKTQMDYLNQMWRNFAINDTYEPGSTFKIVTSAAGLQEGAVTETDAFHCNGAHVVGDRLIKCWRYPRAHGAETFVEGVQNSCNPVFMITAERLGAERFYDYMEKFGFKKKTGVDLPGEAVGIMHKLENVGPVELATMSFGQSFQITPLQLVTAAAAAVNGGRLVTPHVGLGTLGDGGWIEPFAYQDSGQPLTADVSERMKVILESVVSVGTGNRSYIPGYRVGGKTATSEKLPRRSGKYIASFLAFAPAENPQIIALALIDEPQGAYYGGQVTGPVMKEFLENVLPYIGVEPIYSETDAAKGDAGVAMPDFIGLDRAAAKKMAETLKLDATFKGGGDAVAAQFPPPGETVNRGARIILEMDGKNPETGR